MRKFYTLTRGVMFILLLIVFLPINSFAKKTLSNNIAIASIPDIFISTSGPSTICQGESLGLSVATGYSTYNWSNGASTSSISVASAGSYFVTVVDSLSNTLFSDTIVVTVGLPATANTIPDVDLCGYNELGLAGSSVGGSASSFMWLGGTTSSFLDGRFDLNGGYLPDTSEYGTVVELILVTNDPANGCPPGSDTLLINVLDVPDLLPIPNQSNLCPFTGFDLGTVQVVDANNTVGVLFYQDANNNPIGSFITTSGLYQIGKATLGAANCFDKEPVLVTINSCTCTMSLSKTFTDATCPGASDGAIDLSVSGGVPPFTYTWTTGDTIEDLNNLPAGFYSVVVRDAIFCLDTVNVTISETSALNVSCVLNNHVTCPGGSDGFVLSIPTGAVSPISYQWKDGNGNSNASDTLPVLMNIPADTYTCVVTDGAGCVDSCSITITEPAALIATCSNDGNVTSNGGNDGAASVSAIGGTPTYSYLWSNSATTDSINGLIAGTYTATVSDANLCSSTCSITISETPIGPPVATCSNDGNVSCNGGNDGAASVSATGGSPFGTGYIYVWSNGASTSSISGLTAGTYSVVVFDSLASSDTCDVIITEPAALIATCSSDGNVTSNGGNDGAASVSAIGGTPAYSYLWSNSATTDSINGLVAGTYTATVSDANLCTSICSVTIIEPPIGPPVATCSNDGNVSCNGGNDGAASVSVTGGSPFGTGYIYVWSNGASTSSISGLTAGIYTVIVIDSLASSDTCEVIITEPAPLSIVCSVLQNVTCAGGNDGALDFIISGGTSPYNVNVLSGGLPISNGLTEGGLPANTYTVTVTDTLGCTDTCMVTITEPDSLIATCTINQEILCNGQLATTSVSAVGGISPYAYVWSNGSTNAINDSLGAGTHTVTVIDSAGCITTCSVVITEPLALTVNCTIDQEITCYDANDAAASVTVFGGTLPYTYAWSNGMTTASISNLSPNTYTVLVIDSLGCTDSCSVTIANPNPLSSIIAGSNSPICDGNLLMLTASGNYPNYSWTGPNSFVSTLQNPSFISTTASIGMYIVTATDSNACSVSDTIMVAINACFDLGDQTYVDLNQDGLFNGADTALAGVLVTLHDSTGTVIGTMTTDSLGNYLFTDLLAGNYYVTFGAIPGLAFTAFNASGSQVNGANGPGTTGTISIINSDILTVDAGYISGISVGDFVWFDVNGNGLPDDGFTGIPGVSVNLHDSTGTVIDSVVTDVNGNYLFTGVMPGSYYVTFALPAGFNYTVFNPTGSQVTFANGPGTTSMFTVTTTSVLTVDAGFTGTGSIGDLVWEDLNNNGIDDDGGTGIDSVVVQLTYLGPDGILGTIDDVILYDTTDSNGNYSFNNLPPGDYSVMVLDGTGTVLSAFSSTTGGNTSLVSLTSGNMNNNMQDFGYLLNINCNPPLLTLIPIHINCHGDAAGSIDLIVNSQFSPYTYIWSNNSTNEDQVNLVAGTYTVTVTDAGGCTNTSSLIIIENPAIIIGKQVANVSCNGSSDGVAVVNIAGGVPPYTYLWNTVPAQTGFIATGLSAGSATVIVTDNAGCDTTVTFYITEPSIIDAAVSVAGVSCNGASDGSVTVSPIGGTPFLSGAPYTYLWNTIPNQTTQTATGLSGGFYTVQIADSVWCTKTVVVSVPEPAILMVSINPFNVTCNSGSNGKGTAIPSGGTPPFTYLWSDNQTNQAATNLIAGNYTVTVTDANNCTAQASFTLTQPPALSVNALVDDVSCGGANDGKISLSVSGGNAPYSYQWNTSPVLTTSLISGLAAGSYSVVITDANGCQYSNTYIISDSNPLNPIFNVTNVTCYNGNNGSILITQFTGGVSPYTILWSNGNTTMSNSGLSAGTYYLTVTDSVGCAHFDSLIISEPNALIFNEVVNNATCNASATGSIITNLIGGTAPYTYVWSTGESTSFISNLSAGTYTLTVFDSLGCNKTEVFVISEPSIISLVNSVTNVTCNGGNDGSATANPSGGTPPYSYVWSDGQLTQTANGLVAGTYTLTVTDANGCVKVSNVTISEPPLLSLTCTVVNTNCNGANSGSATVVPSGGVPGYSFSWNTFPVQTTQTASNLPPGTYTATVTDANGCTATVVCSVSPAGPLQCSIASTNITCHGGSNGIATVNATGGTTPYSYIWLTSPTQNSQTIIGLSAGFYQVIVTDAVGCFDTCSVQITEPEVINSLYVATNPSCFGYSDGSIDISIIGGTPPYTYMWTTGATTEDLSNIGNGLYGLTVTDFNNCIYNAWIQLIEPPVLSCTISSINESCSGANDGSVTASVSGGTSPYTYLWSDNSTNNSINNASSGTYILTVTDAKGCSSTCIATISSPPVINCGISILNGILCNGDSTGILQANANGGTAPYTYSWNTSPVQTNSIASGLTTGTYTVIITDANGCSVSCSETLSEPALFTCNTNCTHVSCNGASDATAWVFESGGVAPYTYSWNTVPPQTTSLISGLNAGTYIATVTDANGCTTTCSIVIVEPPAIIVNVIVSDVSCHGANDGSATAQVVGGTPPYSYFWSTGDTTNSVSGLSGGSHFLVVTDANNCVINSLFMILEPNQMVCSVINTPVTCNGGNDGTATASAAGGLQPFTYVWSTSPPQNSITATGLSVGTYTVTVSDISGCTTTCSTTIVEPSAITSTPIVTNVTCFSGMDGSVMLTNTTGGTAPYTYLWNSSPVQTTSTLSGVPHGTYSVIITDANGCTVQKQLTITHPNELVCSVTSTPANCGQSNGTASVSAVGGAGGYTFSWNTIPVQTNATAVGLDAGSYMVTVTDSIQCTSICTVIVNGTGAISCTISTTDVSCAGGMDGSATLSNISGGAQPYSFMWNTNPVQTGSTATGLIAGTYSVVIMSVDGCSDVKSVIIFEPAPVPTPIVNSNSPVCVGNTVMLTASSGYSTYNWTGPNNFASSQQNPNFTSTLNANGLYILTVTDSAGCSTSSSIQVVINSCVDIGDFTWIDLNGNGLFDPGEPAVGGVTVTLHDSTGAIIASTVTDSTGMYLFTNVSPGDYYVTFGTVPGYTYTSSNPLGSQVTGGNGPGTTNTFTVDSTDVLTIDAGYLGTGTIGDYVWADLNNNGLQDDGNTGIPGAVVQLTWFGPDSIPGTPDDVIYYDTTDVNGAYLFTNLPMGGYQVMVIDGPGTVLAGLTNTTGGNTTTTSLTPGAPIDLTQDFGYVGSVNVGDFTWIDLNGNGLFDPGEPAVGGVTVTLHDSTGAIVASTVTDSTGMYLFTNVSPGDYYVTFGTVPGYTYTSSNPLGSQVTGGNGPGTTNTFTVDSTDVLTIDAGYLGTGTIGDYVWEDLNNNGLQDDGNTGIPGAVVQLTWFGPDSIPGTPDDVIYYDTTDVNGAYLFTNLPMGGYQVMVIDGPGTVLAGLTNTTGGNTTTTSLTPGAPIDLTQDFGYVGSVNVGDFTWIDLNGNGLFDPGEPAVGGVTVTLHDSTGAIIASTVTDSTGMYLFTNVSPGDYYVTFGTVPGYTYTSSNPLGSQVTGGNGPGTTNTFTVDSTDVLTIDAGYLGTGTIGDYVWEDLNNNGLQDEVNTGIPGAVVQLTWFGPDSIPGTPDDVIYYDTTDVNGAYLFTNLPMGGYQVMVIDGPGTVLAGLTNTTGGNTTTTSLTPGAPIDLTQDFGYYLQQNCIPASLTVFPSNALCYGDSSGSANLTASGGTLPYSFLWSNGATTEDLSNVPSGFYVVTVTSNGGCSSSANAFVGEYPELSCSIFDTSCNIDFNLNQLQAGEIVNEQFANLGIHVSATAFNNLPDSVIIFDSNDSTQLSDPDLQVGVGNLLIIPTNVTDANNDSLVDNPDDSRFGGVITILFDDPVNVNSLVFVDQDNDSLPVFTAYDSLNNVVSTATLPFMGDMSVQTAFLNATNVSKLEVTIFGSGGIGQIDLECNGGANSATVVSSGGLGPYTYSWNTLPVQTTQTINGIGPGTYVATVTDANGCTTSCDIDIATPCPDLALNARTFYGGRNISCNNAGDGIVYGLVNGGTSPYTYQWSNGESTSDAHNLTPGTYSLTVNDFNGCIVTKSINISEPESLSLSGANITDVSCAGDANGSILPIIEGGMNPYYISVNNGQFISDSILTGLSAGLYSVTVQDTNGCVITDDYSISEPKALKAWSTKTNVQCFGGSDGSIDLKLIRGTAPYTYIWNDGTTTQDRNNIPKGNYTVTATDANGCTIIYSRRVIQPKKFKHTAIVTDVSCKGGNDGAIQLTITGGSSPYTYFWNDGTTTLNRTNLTKGWHSIQVTDNKGCIFNKSIKVNQPSYISATLITINVTTPGGNDGSASVTAGGGTPPYTYMWSSGSTISSASNLIAGTYQVTVTDANGCQKVRNFTITESVISVPLTCNAIGSTISCGNNTGTATVTATGGIPPYSYFWNTTPPQTTATATGLTSGTYLVQVTDIRGASSAVFCFATISCNNVKSTHVIENHESILSVYPNPFNNELSVNIYSAYDEEKFELVVVNMLGKTIYQSNITATMGMNSNKIKLTNLPSGIYFVKLKSKHSSFVRRLIKH